MVAYWEHASPRARARVEEIDYFDARGMARVYSREDYFGRHFNLRMDIWRTRDGRLLMRCSSLCGEVDWCCLEIHGVNPARIVPRQAYGFPDSWIPAAVRRAYDAWVEEQF